MRPLSGTSDLATYRLDYDAEGAPKAAWMGEKPFRLVINPTGPEALSANDMAVASLNTPLTVLIKLVNATGNGVILMEDGKVCGLCDQPEIIAALSRG
jgi:hypothetical protein